jgi:glycosyltransferase involved in cell wall biosynthesis
MSEPRHPGTVRASTTLHEPMNAGLRTILVVPAYNEAHRLDSDAFVRFARDHPDTGFLFVNDGSTDETASRLAELCARAPDQCAFMSLDANAGKAEAVRHGLLAAAGRGAEYIGFWDADLSTPLASVPYFTATLDTHPGVVMVAGARIRLLGRHITRKAARHYVGRVFAAAASIVLNLPIYDTQCGAKLFRAAPDVVEIFDEPFRSRWIFDVEMIARLIARGFDGNHVIYELPLLVWSDVAGSRLRLKDFARAPAQLAYIYWRYTRGAAFASGQRAQPGTPAKLPPAGAPTRTRVGS